ncbi:MAG TPA: PD-(D/E)XK nuclease family protein [Anaerolineae bacterium]|nr:PD-(D/E)XK nuclease family protein [Anaerolineae bacterium]HOQ99745.1 PD-(D/E)XK nuclease family protein [Anaerolineae bacterium]HPL28522.1 PD-(D/E)XK nuclease family protein [Anaerolineae bacterium]
MAVHLFIAPAGAGKTEATIGRLRAAAHERPLQPVWAVLPNRAQVFALRRRLAARGGALGVEVGTFFALYHEALRAAGQVYAELDEPLQHRALRAVVDEAAAEGRLQHYAPLRDKPGFVRALHHLIEELKQARVQPAQLEVALHGEGPRLEELAMLYAGYQRRLRVGQWMDAEGLGWLATAALSRAPRLLAGWGLVAVDGFDQLNQTQVAFLAELARQVPELRITLTWSVGPARLAHRRFAQALERLEQKLGVAAEPLVGARVRLEAPLAALEAGLFEPAAPAGDPGAALSFVEAPNRALEARAALRWAKERLVCDSYAPADVAILARDLAPYAPFLEEVAAEFGLPLALLGGRPLAANPAVAALLRLLGLARRDRSSASLPDGRFPVRATLEALRSPYFDWQRCSVAGEPLGLSDGDVAALERAAQAARLLGGLAEWREALALQATPAPAAEDGNGEATGMPAVEVRAALAARFERLVARVTPPAADTVAGYTAFVEDLIGDDGDNAEDGDPESLRLLQRIRSGPPELAVRDAAALRQFKEALRGLVWADAALGPGEPVAYERFLDELEGIVAAGQYEAQPEAGEAVCAASAHDARGLTFRAVALLGLAEGEFPRATAGDPLLRDGDRERLAGRGLPLEPPPVGAEFTLFYEATTRARERLLLTRPYLAADGQPWEPSPFWEEALRLSGGAQAARVVRVRSADPLPLERAASWAEALAAAGQQPAAAAAVAAEPEVAPLWQAAQHGAVVLAARLAVAPAGPFEGDCAALAPALHTRYGSTRPWSASRLEAYLGCPLRFFLSYALKLPEPAEPTLGYNAAQLGTMYHEILERVYRAAPGGGLEELLAALPGVAAEVLAEAPRRQGFRPGRLWHEEQARITGDVENTLRALADVSVGWQPVGLELRFGMVGDPTPPQRIRAAEGGELLLHGVIDRADRDASGRVRLIDYKTTGEAITAGDLLEGRRIQLALYAWAAQGVLGLGAVAGGFYWHLRQAKRSSLTLDGLDGGAEGAMQWAAEHAWRAVSGVRAGAFAPEPNGHTCPDYCLGTAFCWRYRAK